MAVTLQEWVIITIYYTIITVCDIGQSLAVADIINGLTNGVSVNMFVVNAAILSLTY
jgi:hypothetical protein